jgi:hypothetical protein
MTSLRRRLQTIQTLAAKVTAHRPEEPASVRWLSVLKVLAPVLEKNEPTPDNEAAIRRTRESIVFLEDYVTAHLSTRPWAYLEYYCQACMLRLSYSTPDWEGRQIAVMEADYEEHMREIEQIERHRI